MRCKHRIHADEMIDRPETPAEDIRENLCDLAVINRWLGGANATLAHALPLLRSSDADPVRVLDAACGGGDLSRRMVDEARRIGKRIEITALDLNETVLRCAEQMSAGYPEIMLIHGDALHPPFPQCEFDIVILSTFIHHLEPDQVIAALQAGKNMSRGCVIVADLVRSTLAYLGYWVFSRVAGFSRISIRDGGISVCRSYTPSELADLADRAGLQNWKLYRHRLYRMALVYEGKGS